MFKNVRRKFLSAEPGRLNLRSALGNTFLHWAVLRGREKLVTELLGLPNIDVTVRSGKTNVTPLYLAAHNGNSKILKTLMTNLAVQAEFSQLSDSIRQKIIKLTEINDG